MAVTQGNLIWDIASGNLKDLKSPDACSVFITDTGWKSTNLCHDGSMQTVVIGLDSFPLPNNVRVIGAAVSGAYNGPRGTIGYNWKNDYEDLEFGGGIIAQGGGSWNFQASINTADYGVPLSFSVGIFAPNDAGAFAVINSIVLSILVDDSLPEGLPGDPQDHPPVADCIDTVTYAAGSGPDCVVEQGEYTFTSSGDRVLNQINCTFLRATGFQIIGYTNWSLQSIQNTYWIDIESPVGTTTLKANKSGAQDPVLQNFLSTATKLVIYGDNNSGPFTMRLRIAKVNDTDAPNPSDPNATYGDIFTGLNGIKEAINTQIGNLNDGVTDKLFNIGFVLDELKNDLPANLISALVSSVTGAPQSVVQGLLGSLQIPSNLVQDLLNFIDAIVTSETDTIKTSLQELGIATQSYLSSHVVSQGGLFDTTLSAQERVVNNLLEGKYSDADTFFNDLKGAGNNIALIEWLQNAYLIIFGTIGFLKAKTNIADIVTTQILLGEYTPNINDLSTLVTDLFRGAISLTELQDYAKRYGLDVSKVTELISAARPLPNPQEIREGFVRGFITQAQHDKYLQMLGFGQDDIAYLKTLYNIQLGPSDVTRIADKHIYSTDIPTIFGQYTELDQGYIDDMAKLGINADQTSKLWAAHWSLTGLQDTFSMYHRGIINDTELNTWFALTDIMPFFREKLKQLNYSLVTRVDIRRFYAEGLYNEEQVTQAYKKLGFNDADAQLQTQYTVLHERESENPTKVKIKTLTESMVIKAYKRGIIDENTAINRLTQVGYLPADAQLVLRLETQIDSTSFLADKTQHYHDKLLNHILASLSKGTVSEDEARSQLTAIGVPQAEIESEVAYAALERVLQLKEFVENHVRTAYTSGQIDKPTAINLMADIGFNMNEITYLFEELDLVKQLRNKQLTETQLKDIYNAGVIDRDTLYTELQNLGYTDKHAQWLTDTIAPIGV